MNTVSATTIPAAFSSGTQGMAAASTRLTQSAEKIVNASRSDSTNHASAVQINQQLVEMKREQLLFTASARVVRTSDNMIGSLLDIRV